MKARIAVLLLSLSVCCGPARGQAPQKSNPDEAQPANLEPRPATTDGGRITDSGSLTWTASDVNPKTVFWVQGRWVPVGDADHQGDAEVVTILCLLRESECLEFDSTSPFKLMEQVWIEDFKSASWDHNGILATTRSLDGCTDETLRIRFSPPSVALVNSPILPISANCKKLNKAWDKLSGKAGSAIAAQIEQDELVPTRGPIPFQDVPGLSRQKNQ